MCSFENIMQTLSRALVRYQKDEEQQVLSEAVDDNEKRRLKNMLDMLRINSSDLGRVYSNAEMKSLCLRTKVRVNMTLYNCVWDARKRLDRKNRLQNRSTRFVNAMLVKAVQRRMVIPYTDAEIAKCNHIRACLLKKDNNIRLDRWRYDEPLQDSLQTDAVNGNPMITHEDWTEDALRIDPELMVTEMLLSQSEELALFDTIENYNMFCTQGPQTSTEDSSVSKSY